MRCEATRTSSFYKSIMLCKYKSIMSWRKHREMVARSKRRKARTRNTKKRKSVLRVWLCAIETMGLSVLQTVSANFAQCCASKQNHCWSSSLFSQTLLTLIDYRLLTSTLTIGYDLLQ
jgi:hypothetical protein